MNQTPLTHHTPLPTYTPKKRNTPQGRLGKEEQGITKVPEVVVRPERIGLGIIKEATQLRANREIEAVRLFFWGELGVFLSFY